MVAGSIVLLTQAEDLQSASYRLRHASLNAGGGEAVSSRYRLVAAMGAFGGQVGSAGNRVVDRQGFAGALNDPPRAVADTARRAPGQPLKIRVGSLLANDSDPERDRLELRDFAAASEQGGVITYDNGWLLYQPPASFNGTDTFDYTLEDAAGNVGRARVTVLVAGTGPEPSQNLVAIELLPGGHKRITFAGIARRRYVIEWTDTLPATHWHTLAVVEADARGIIEWVDATVPAPPERYYRTLSE